MNGVTVEVRKPFVGASLSITGSPDDFGVLGAVGRGGGYYAPNVMRFIKAVVRPGWTCFDVGAHIGVLSCVIGQHCAPGMVYAFEPSSQNCEWLRTNVVQNRCSNVSVVQSAVYSRAGLFELHGSATHPGGNFISETGVTAKTNEAIRAITIDEFVTATTVDRVDFIKMDVEGSELHALDGARSTIERDEPTVVVECNPVALGRFQDQSAGALFDRLAGWYGRVGYLDHYGAVHRLRSQAHLEEVLTEYGLVDLVAGVGFVPRRPTRLVMYALVGLRRRWFPRTRVSTSPPRCAFATKPGFDAHFAAERVEGAPDAFVSVPLRLRNTSSIWYSSQYENHAIVASYRIRHGRDLVEDDGVRTLFDTPIAPGAEATVDLAVRLPCQPGQYTLEFTLVQEAFAWFDDIDPSLRVLLPVTVTDTR